MFTVGTILKKSSIEGAGLGVFTTEDIKKGQKVWVHGKPLRMKEEAVQSLPKELKEEIIKLSELHKGERYIYFDTGNYVNHSISMANIEATFFHSDMFATKDIQAGEELYCNYYLTDEDAVRKLQWA